MSSSSWLGCFLSQWDDVCDQCSVTRDPCPVGGAKETARCATGSGKQSVLCEMKQFPSAHSCAWDQVLILLLRVGVLSSASPLLCRMPEVLSFLLLCL